MSGTRSQRVAVFFQEACLSHRFIRSRDKSAIVERPQRLRAVKTGVATAIARLELTRENRKNDTRDNVDREDNLASALERLNISEGGAEAVNVVMSCATVDILSHPAVKYVHGDVDGDVYLKKLVALIRESEQKVARGESEIPEGLPQGDLYLCNESLDAIQGAIGAVCEAVDTVIQSTGKFNATEASRRSPTIQGSSFQANSSRAFVAIRPPGHHCGEDTPSGFCFLNNVAIGAAHAHLQHGITRVAILDIDLHHGNGTQSIAWQINEETHRQRLESEASNVSGKPGLKIYYGSIHDVLSYPCEDGNATRIQAASVSLNGPHGQHIENVHLLPYDSDQEFWDRLYHGPYTGLLRMAEAFLKQDQSQGEAIIFISAGFDASEHEYSSMSRHGRKVPTGFYHRFAHDVRNIADQYAEGRVVSVLEGGYSDRALCSGAMAHVLGLAEEGQEVDADWWSLDNLIKIEKASKTRRGGRASSAVAPSTDKWIERSISALSKLCPNPSPPPSPKKIPPSTMTLRDRSKKSITPSTSASSAGTPSPKSLDSEDVEERINTVTDDVKKMSAAEISMQSHMEGPKKLPKVVLRVNPPKSDPVD